MKNLSYKKLFEISIFSKGEGKRGGCMKMIYGTCPNCGNSKSPFWVKSYKCSKCGADKFEWHTRAWCGNMLNLNNEYINKIIEIGKKESCTDKDLDYFKENLPDVINKKLRNILQREYEVSISHITRREFLSFEPKVSKQQSSEADTERASFLVNLIKGCHLIETKYGGFGSTTNIYNIIGSLLEIDTGKAIDLYNWIAFNGGNYYIESNVTYEDSRRKEQNAEKNRVEILLNDQKIHSDAVARKQQNRDLHTKTTNKTQLLYKECKEGLQKMSDEQLINSFNKDVGNKGWVGARARFHSALHEEFENRGFDFSAIGNKNSLSFANKIKLIGKKIVKNT